MRQRVAVLIPAYNAAAYLPELLATVAGQTVQFDEVLCYDDGSTDGTADVARAHGAKVITGSRNRGAAFARNRLLDATTCEWVHFHDADDLLDPTFVERMTAAASPGTVVLCGMRAEDRASRLPVGRVSYDGLTSADDPIAFFLRNTAFAIIGLYPRDVLLRIGGFREDLRGNEDPDLHVRLAIAGTPFVVESSDLVTNLMHARSFSASHRLRCLQDRLRCLESYAAQRIGRTAVVGQQAMSAAWLLFEAGDRRSGRAAVSLAQRCGVRAVDSHRWLTRFMSRTLGPTAVFWMRHILWQRSRTAGQT